MIHGPLGYKGDRTHSGVDVSLYSYPSISQGHWEKLEQQAGQAELGQAQLQLELAFTLIKVYCITLMITLHILSPISL